MAKKSTKTRLSKDEVEWLKKHDNIELMQAYDRLHPEDHYSDQSTLAKHTPSWKTKKFYTSDDIYKYADREEIDPLDDRDFTSIEKKTTDKSSIEQSGYAEAMKMTQRMHSDKVYIVYVQLTASKSNKMFKDFEFGDNESTCSMTVHVPIYAVNEEDANQRMQTYLDRLSLSSYCKVNGSELTNKSLYILNRQLHEDRRNLMLAQRGKLRITSLEEEHIYKFRYCLSHLIPSHVLAIPTKKMWDEMTASIDWVNNLINKIRDEDIKENRRLFFSTERGKEWKKVYDEDMEYIKHIDSIIPYVSGEYTVDGKSPKKSTLDKSISTVSDISIQANKEKQKKLDSYREILDILDKVSKNKKYVSGIAPIKSSTFAGTSYAFMAYDSENIMSKFRKFDKKIDTDKERYQNMDIKILRAYNPNINSRKVDFPVKLTYCELDDSVSNQDCINAFNEYAHKKTINTFKWCQRKDKEHCAEDQSRKPMTTAEIWTWCVNILKKNYPSINPSPFRKEVAGDDNTSKALNAVALNTIQWVIDMANEHKFPQIRTENTILSVLRKHGIDPATVEDDINAAIYKKYKKSLTMSTKNKLQKN